MLAILVAAAVAAAGGPLWHCRNQVEIWCADGACTARPADEITPMDISADARKGAGICAYSGCWNMQGRAKRINGRLLWTDDEAHFSSPGAGVTSGVTLLIIEKDGAGFVRADGIATPILCERAPKE